MSTLSRHLEPPAHPATPPPLTLEAVGTAFAARMHVEQWRLNFEKKCRMLADVRKAHVGKKLAAEDVAEKVARQQLNEAHAVCALHLAAGDTSFLNLLMKVGSGPDLVAFHNVWVLQQVKDEDSFTFEKWGEILHLVPYPIMPFHISSIRLVEYNEKLYDWARAQATAGAGPDQKRKPPEFLSLFANGPTGGTGPYMPVEQLDGHQVVNGAQIKVVLDEHKRAQDEATAVIIDLRARLAEAERSMAEMRAHMQQQAAQSAGYPAQQPDLVPPMKQPALPQQYAAQPQQQQPQQYAPQQYAPPQQQYMPPPQQQYMQPPQQQYAPQQQQQYVPQPMAYQPYPLYAQYARAPGGGQPRAMQRPPPVATQRTVCDRCQKTGHFARDCRAAAPRGGEGDKSLDP